VGGLTLKNSILRRLNHVF